MKKRLLAYVLLSAMLTVYFLTGTTTEQASSASRQEEIEFSLIQGWNLNGGEGDLIVFDICFSKDILTDEQGLGIGYRINDGDLVPSENYTYLQRYITFNGKKMSEINAETDISSYTFLTFPSTLDATVDDKYIYKVPIMIYVPTPERMQIRISKQYYQEHMENTGVTVQILQGFYAAGQVYDDFLAQLVDAEFRLSNTVTFTKDANHVWTSDRQLVNYQPTPEFIDRADIDFSKIDYKTIYATEVSDIMEFGSAVTIDGKEKSNQYIVFYFDKDISYQYIPYVSAGKNFLEGLAANPEGLGVTLTQAQIDSVYDYRIDSAFNYNIKINGKTLKELKESENTNADFKINPCLSGSTSHPHTFTLYISADSEAWLDKTQTHTVEIVKGFRTPLFGEIKQTQTFYYQPETGMWSENNYAVNSGDNGDTSSCSGAMPGMGGLIFVTLLTTAAVLNGRKRGNKYV